MRDTNCPRMFNRSGLWQADEHVNSPLGSEFGAVLGRLASSGSFMHVIVLGAGLLGVTSAYYLAREGHQVTVIDRQPEVARETSFANAGLLTPGHAYDWASPRAPMILLKS